ncbi:MAG: sensor histidine kinase N-terminal domain-containing protein, partial [Pseudomonadota bacterium]|nr:sensor histidine kinase N-terminal domain-containing protein [Pseudomonadota bacterium]
MEEDVLSLRDHLMNWLLTPLFVLWLFSTVAGYVATLNYANQPYDLALLERAQSVAVQMRLGSGQERLDITPALPDGSDPGMPDRVYFAVS